MNKNRRNNNCKAAERICHDVKKNTMQILIVVVAAMSMAMGMPVVFMMVTAAATVAMTVDVTIAVSLTLALIVVVPMSMSMSMVVPVSMSMSMVVPVTMGTLVLALRASKDADMGMVVKRKQTNHVDDKTPTSSADQIVLVHFRRVNETLH